MQEILSLITKIPSAAWVALFTALLTSSLTLMGIRYTNKSHNERLNIQLTHERKLKQDELLRDRLEELYVESRKYMNHMITHFLPYLKVMQGELTYNEALDLNIAKGNITHNPDRVHLIMDMYFPELRESFRIVEKRLDIVNDINDGYKHQYKQGDYSGHKWLPLFQKALKELGDSTSNFEKHVSSIAKNARHINQHS